MSLVSCFARRRGQGERRGRAAGAAPCQPDVHGTGGNAGGTELRRGRDREDWGLLSPLEIRTADLYLCVLRWFVCFKKHHILGTDTYG